MTPRARAGVLVVAAVAVALCAPAVLRGAQEVTADAAQRLTIRGFVGTSLFVQDRLFGPGNGQNAQWSEPDGVGRWWLGGDVRNTRLTLDIVGPRVFGGWEAGGTVEADFFGGFSGTGGFAAEQPLPRLRLAYGQVARGGTVLRLGQAWAPLSGYVPESVNHVAFPLGYGAAGQIGWRFPGIFLYQDLVRGDWGRLQLQAAMMRGAWDDAPDPELPTAGELAGPPQLEARFDLEGGADEGTLWGAYLVGHVDRKDLGASLDPGVDGRRFTGWAAQFGARVEPGPLTLHGNVYVGRAIGQHAAHISQFGDIRGWGGWTQLGAALGRRWSVWTFYGVDDPRDRDLAPGDRLRNRVFAQLLRVEEAPFAVGLEWLHTRTRWWLPVVPSPSGRRLFTGNQIALGVLIDF